MSILQIHWAGNLRWQQVIWSDKWNLLLASVWSHTSVGEHEAIPWAWKWTLLPAAASGIFFCVAKSYLWCSTHQLHKLLCVKNPHVVYHSSITQNIVGQKSTCCVPLINYTNYCVSKIHMLCSTHQLYKLLCVKNPHVVFHSSIAQNIVCQKSTCCVPLINYTKYCVS